MVRKKIIIIILIILAGVILTVYYFFKFTMVNIPKKPVITINEKSAEPKPFKSAIDNKNDDVKNYEQAIKSKNLSLCEKLSETESIFFCIKEIAIADNSSSTCEAIRDQAKKTDCQDYSILAQATAFSNLSLCENISQNMLKQTCVDRIAENNLNIDCDLFKNDELKIRCYSVFYYQKAKESHDAQFCDKITVAINKANCLSEIKEIDLHSDADKDGLDFLAEIINGTDPDDADTDNDGHYDGEEVKSSYNPLGEGKQPSIFINCFEIKDARLKSLCFMEMENGNFNRTNVLKCDEIKNQELKFYCSQSNM